MTYGLNLIAGPGIPVNNGLTSLKSEAVEVAVVCCSKLVNGEAFAQDVDPFVEVWRLEAAEAAKMAWWTAFQWENMAGFKLNWLTGFSWLLELRV
jgi:hypothetical protein